MTPLPFQLQAYQDWVRSGSVSITVNGALWFERGLLVGFFDIQDPHAAVQWPDDAPRQGRADDLWKQNCMEVFVKSPSQKTYWEYNFSPLGLWNCYKLLDYRQGSTRETGVSYCDIRFQRSPCRLEFSTALPEALRDTDLHIAVACVLVTKRGTAHFAFSHPASKPDFHRAENFQLAWQGISK